MYRVGVRGLYCYGNNTEDWTRKDDPSVRYAKLYGQSGENRLYHELPTISSAASESKIEGLGTYNDNGMYVPYNMEEFTAFKNAGLVKETSVLVPVGKDGKLRIGMSRDYMKVSIDLCFVDDFSLTYYGNSDDAFYMWRDEVIGTSLNKEKIADAIFNIISNALKNSSSKAVVIIYLSFTIYIVNYFCLFVCRRIYPAPADAYRGRFLCYSRRFFILMSNFFGAF